MGEVVKAAVLIVVLLLGLPIFILVLRDQIENTLYRWRNTPEKLAADRLLYEQRILRPDWDFYERHLQRPVPRGLRDLYADRAFVTGQSLEYTDSDWISTFEPIEELGLVEMRPQFNFDVVPFATSGCGDPIYLRPGSTEADTVYVTYHDGGDTEVFATSIEAMIERLRHVNRGS